MSEQPTFEPESNDEFQLDLRQYWDTILRRRWAIFVFFTVTVSVVTLFTTRQPKIYSAGATLIIETQAPQVLGNQVQDVVEVGSGVVWASKEYYETQFNIIRSRSLAQLVVERLGLDRDDAFLGIDKIPDPKVREEARKHADPVSMIQGGIKVAQVRDSKVVTISYEDRDPARAARIVNAVVDVYVQQNVDRKVDLSRSAADWLQGQLTSLKDQLEKSEVALYDYKRQHDLVDSSFENKQNLSQQKLNSIFNALVGVQQHKAELEAKVRTIQTALKAGDELQIEALPEVAKNSEVSDLRKKRADLRVELEAMQTKYGPENPKVLEAQERSKAVEDALHKEVRRAINVNLNDYKVVTATEDNLLRLLELAKKDAFEVNKKEMDYKRLARDDENNQRLYELVLKRLKDIDLSGLLKANNVYKLDPALVPGGPIKPRVSMNIMLGAVLGLLGGLVLAFFLEYQDSTISTQEELERILAIPTLGLVPTIKAGSNVENTVRDVFTQSQPKSSVAECCRIIRTNLNFLASERPLRAVLVTSSGPQEGKTTSLVNVAITMAQSDKRILLIDTDLRRPRLHRTFKVPNDRGVSTLIAEGGDIESCIKATEVPGLFLLPSGPVPPNPAELLHTERFRNLLEQAKGRFDRVMLDSPPVGAVSDALVLSGLVDGVVVVLKAFQSDRALSKHTLRALRDVRANILGGILNNVDLDKKQYGYYQGYYYGYGKYYGEPQQAPGKAS